MVQSLRGRTRARRGAPRLGDKGISPSRRVAVSPCRRFLTTRALAAGLLAAAGACASKAPPSAERPPPPPPDLAGMTVMVLPLQPGTWPGSVAAAPPRQPASGQPAGRAAEGAGTGREQHDVDSEIAYWLGERGPRVRWVFPPRLERALARTPALGIQLHSLAVSSFYRAKVQRIGDPLFGDLRRLGALVDARYALLPVAGGYVAAVAGGSQVEIAAALIDTIGGDVLWFGVFRGVAGDLQDPALIPTAAQALARGLIP
ncbi:MAG: hypothetical protein HY703_07285 [Gemmatimonadetes bacterium]|nr:hypothetical protein [Gemmatimonadota bacterium]